MTAMEEWCVLLFKALQLEKKMVESQRIKVRQTVAAASSERTQVRKVRAS